MERISISPRPDWKETAERYGFRFHTIDGEPYWDESAYYAFSLKQVERDIEDPTGEIHQMAMSLVGDVLQSEALLTRLAIPQIYWDWIAESWRRGEHHLYGRMDLAYDGSGPAKLYELNYDTPTSLYEASFFQWVWLDDHIRAGTLPKGTDQYNNLQEKLVLAFSEIAKSLPRPFYFSAVKESSEDQGTIDYLRDCATQAGVSAGIIAIEDIGLSTASTFTDQHDVVIGTLFKLYPLEHLFIERFGPTLPASGLRLIEPPWKAVLSNKGILPLLWERFPNHPNLLPAYFDEDPTSQLANGWVRKPLFSREGANITMQTRGGEIVASDGPYTGGPCIRQAYHPLTKFGRGYPLIGSWVIGDSPAGMGIREDMGLITRDTSRFMPHIIRQ